MDNLATRDEMSNRDWETRLARAKQEATAGKSTTLDAYVKRRTAR